MTFKRTFIFQDNESREKVKPGLHDCLKNLPKDKKFRITVEDYKEDKTAEQRAFLHTLCGILGNEIGLTKLKTKAVIKERVFGYETVTVGGEEYQIMQSSEDAERDEYSELIAECYVLAEFLGVVLPNARYAA